MIKVMSSVGKVTALDITDNANEFFKSSSILNVEILLNTIMETKKIEWSITTSMAMSLLHGSFFWTNSMTPSGLTCSIINSEDIFWTNILQEGMVLDYSTTFKMSSVSLEKLTKSQVLFPTDTEGMIKCLRSLQALIKFFFSERSYPAQGLTYLVKHCINNKMLLLTKTYLNNEFITKFAPSMIDYINRSCCNSDFVQETNLELMNYTSLFQDISLSRFNYHLPLNIKPIQKRTSNSSSNSDKVKRQKRINQVRNNNIVADWELWQNEKWETVFHSKSRDNPVLSVGCAVCLEFQVKGVCYTDCALVVSHKELSGNDKDLTNKYIQKLRGEWFFRQGLRGILPKIKLPPDKPTQFCTSSSVLDKNISSKQSKLLY